ncbi:MAG TPA: hypothetical protein VIR57_06160 [Chloroflexota bacterium]|jgi:hypothetical protein
MKNGTEKRQSTIDDRSLDPAQVRLIVQMTDAELEEYLASDGRKVPERLQEPVPQAG